MPLNKNRIDLLIFLKIILHHNNTCNATNKIFIKIYFILFVLSVFSDPGSGRRCYGGEIEHRRAAAPPAARDRHAR